MALPNKDQTFDRLQKLISQLEIQGEVIAQEDMNLKLLRSLPSEWKTHALIWRNKEEIETISLDDLYNNLKIYEPELTGSSCTSQKLQNVAFGVLQQAPRNQENMRTENGSSSNSDSEVDSCSKTCVKAYATLKEQYDSLNSDYNKSQFNLVSYKAGLESVEARLVEYKKKLEKAEKERDELKLTLEKFQNSSKSLNNLLESQVSDKFKTGLGYNAASSTAASPAVESFVNSSEMLENQEYNKSKSDKGYHAVPPPYTGNFIPSKPDLMFMDEIVESENVDVITIITPSDVKKVETNHESADIKNKGDAVEPKTVRKNSFRSLIIKDWNSDDDSEREFSVARTPQQNDVAKRKNRTLIEATRTMLVDSKLQTSFWAEVVNTACYVLNRVLVIKPNSKIPYELIRGRTPLIDFIKPFGCPVTILNTRDHLGKFDGKADEVFFVGKWTWLFDVDSLSKSMNYVPVVVGNQTNGIAGTRDNIVAVQPVRLFEPSSTNDAPSSPVNAAKTLRTSFNKFSPFKNAFTLPDVPNVSPMDDNTVIFAGAYDDEDVGGQADLNNLETTVNVSSIPTTRINKDHSIELIIRDLHSAPLTRWMSQQNLEEHLMTKSDREDMSGLKTYSATFSLLDRSTDPEMVDPCAFMVDLSCAVSADGPTKFMSLVPVLDTLLLLNPKPILQIGLFLHAL
ncbi:retrovirus-related pol polyprotein from transposon TNT 1-94 [Tanacetum coccineum]